MLSSPAIIPLPYYIENSLGSLPFLFSFPLQNKIRIFNTSLFPNDKKLEWWPSRELWAGERPSLFMLVLCIVTRQSDDSGCRTSSTSFPAFPSCLLGNHRLPLNFTLFTCKMWRRPRRVGRFHEITPGDMFHKMLFMCI